MDYLPNIVVLGVGHSGTRFVVETFSVLGWNTGKVDLHYELPAIIRLNDSNPFDCKAARELITGLPEPWIIKDPRFVASAHGPRLYHWLGVMDELPLLVHLSREAKPILESHIRRKEKVSKSRVRELQPDLFVSAYGQLHVVDVEEE